MTKIRVLIFLVLGKIAKFGVERGIRKFILLKNIYNFLRRHSKGNHTIGHAVYDSQSSWQYVLVDVTTLDKFFEKYNNTKIDVIKIDVEGAEGEVFEGMADIIRNNDNLIIFTELDPGRLEDLALPQKVSLTSLETKASKFAL